MLFYVSKLGAVTILNLYLKSIENKNEPSYKNLCKSAHISGCFDFRHILKIDSESSRLQLSKYTNYYEMYAIGKLASRGF